jgi:threonyl-tRNA synthetase
MLHRAVLGSLERFLGILIEHYAGAFPVWLAPVQARVLPLNDKLAAYAAQVCATLREAGFRAEVDGENDKLGAKIRRAQVEKIPYMLVVGGREAEAGAVSVRSREKGDQGTMPLAEFLEKIRMEAKA